MNDSATSEEIREHEEKHGEPHPVFDVPHRPERERIELKYRCFGCGAEFDSLDDMTPVPGAGNRSPRHFCDWCLGKSKK